MGRIEYQSFFDAVKDTKLAEWAESVKEKIEDSFDRRKNGNLQGWFDSLDKLPTPTELAASVKEGRVAVGDESSFDISAEKIEPLLKEFMPWRKGPWEISGTHIDTEWHSDWKWERLVSHLSPLEGRKILDVGAGNGYYCYRMALAGAKLAVGIDPGMLSVMQAQVMHRYSQELPAWVLPLGIEDMPQELPLFDTLFSMGVLYHRRSPVDHLFHLKGLLRKKGELVLETIVVDDAYGEVLIPENRYGKMRNVWFIPSVSLLEKWLRRAGFINIKTVDVCDTSLDEQRPTEWMTFESLSDFLDPHDSSKTVEGYPAPKRAVVIAQKG